MYFQILCKHSKLIKLKFRKIVGKDMGLSTYVQSVFLLHFIWNHPIEKYSSSLTGGDSKNDYKFSQKKVRT